MSQKERERMIARYTGGRMGPEEERQFLGLVESDPELRRAIETERVIDRTLRRDRDMLPMTGAETRSHVLALVGALAPASVEIAATGIGIGIGKIAMIVAGIALTAGTLFLVSPREGSVETAPPRSAATPIELRHHTPQPPKHSSPSTTMDTATEVNATSKERVDAVMPRPAQPRGIPLGRRIEAADNVATPSKEASPIPAEPPVPSAPRIADTAAAPSLAPPPTRAADSTLINVTIDLDRMKRKPRQP